MTRDELQELFEKYEDSEYIKFDRIPAERRFSNRPDLNAFILLDKLVPGKSDIVACAEHDEIYLETNLDKLADAINEDQILDLVRCGVRFGEDGLCMLA